MNAAAGLSVGIGLTLVGWLLPRAVAGTRAGRPAAMMLDLALPLLGFAMIAAATARPIFAGGVGFGVLAAFAFADRAKRRVLLEPIVYSDAFQTFDILRHPELCLPFPHAGRVVAGASAVVALLVGLFFLDRTAWSWSPWLLVGGVVAVILAGWLLGGPLCGRAGQVLRGLRPSGDPVRDAAALGPLAMQLTHGVIARAERSTRRRALGVAPAVAVKPAPARGPVVVVQCESFFDPRRLHPALAAPGLPAFDACRRASVQWGRLRVPGWGANTVRTEFAALTGLSEAALGFDRFNPYHRLARAPIRSLVWRLRAEGYRTLCLHPFDRRFYGRDRVMRNLGFDGFLGEEAFAGAARIGLFVADAEVARVAAAVMREEGPGVFIFAITMENHGPWRDANGAATLPLPEETALRRFIASTGNADGMLATLMDALAAWRSAGLLAFYGDHLPSFPAAFRRLGFGERDSDYVIWRGGGGGLGQRHDLAAHELPGKIWEALAAEVPRPRQQQLAAVASAGSAAADVARPLRVAGLP